MTVDMEEFLAELMGGEHDGSLDELAEEVKQRVAVVRKRATRGLEPGDRFVVRDEVTPRYLRGERGEVVKVSGSKLVVKFDNGHPESGEDEEYRLDPRQVKRLRSKEERAEG